MKLAITFKAFQYAYMSSNNHDLPLTIKKQNNNKRINKQKQLKIHIAYEVKEP